MNRSTRARTAALNPTCRCTCAVTVYAPDNVREGGAAVDGDGHAAEDGQDTLQQQWRHLSPLVLRSTRPVQLLAEVVQDVNDVIEHRLIAVSGRCCREVGQQVVSRVSAVRLQETPGRRCGDSDTMGELSNILPSSLPLH